MLFLSRAESLPTNSSYAAWIFYHLSHNKWSYLSMWFFLLSQYSQTWGFRKKKRKGIAGFDASHTQASLSDCSHLVSTCSGRSIAHGGLSATQSSGGAGVTIQLGSPGRGTCCICIIVTGARKQQSYSANANVVFTRSASLHHKDKGLPRSTCLLKWTKTWKNFPPATQYQRNQSDPSQPGLQHSEECAMFCYIIWTICFKRCAEEGEAVTNGLS